MIPSFISPEAKDLLKRLLVRNSEQRLGVKHGAIEIKNHPWFDDIEWAMIEQKRVKPQKRKPRKVHVENITWDQVLEEDRGLT